MSGLGAFEQEVSAHRVGLILHQRGLDLRARRCSKSTATSSTEPVAMPERLQQ